MFAVKTSPVNTERTLPPEITRSAGSSPRATAVQRSRILGCAALATHSQRHNRLRGMQPVLRLVVDDGLRPINHLICYFVTPVSGQAVHVDRVPIGEVHAPLVADPVLVTSRDGESFLRPAEQLFDPPALRVDDIGALERLV